MFDPNLLRLNPKAIKAFQYARGRDEQLIERATETDGKRGNAIDESEALRAEQTSETAAAPIESNQADTTLASPTTTDYYKLIPVAKNMGENKLAQTRFIQIGLAENLPNPTGSDKTSVIVGLPSNKSGVLLAMLDHFSTRGFNIIRIESRPIGDKLGHNGFNIDAEGHVMDESMSEALVGLHRFNPKGTFLGPYPRADYQQIKLKGNNSNIQYAEARKWQKPYGETID